ncbi:MAG: S8 family serine peptidase [Oscillospiraceae bacterium]|nr:S8 family serine peptidase [Oscillospiraceae bacterium]
MKRLRKYIGILLALALLLSGISMGSTSIGALLDQNAGVGGSSPEFVSAAISIIQENWQDNYFSSATMTIGEDKLTIDGQDTNAASAIIEDGELFLPIADIAEIIGFEADRYDDESAASGTSAFSYDKDDAESMGVDGFASQEETEQRLNVRVQRDGDLITITKPYQTKELIVRTEGNAKLLDTFGATAVADNGYGLYLLQYASEESAQYAHVCFETSGNVMYAEPNGVVALNKAVPTNAGLVLADRWGSERIAADRFKEYLIANNKTGTELLVAVVDTGIDAAHPFLQDRVRADLGYNFISSNTNTDDENNHGTHVSGTIADCTPANVNIIPVKVLNASGYGTDLQASFGIEYAADKGAKVINMSFGSGKSEESLTMQTAVDYAEKLGAACVAAAGNDTANAENFVPASFANVITVSAIDLDDTLAWFSNYGDGIVDIAAPGVDICSCIPGGGYAYYNGTSMAAPHVAAAVAMLKLEFPAATPEQLKQAVKKTAYGTSSTNFGAGILELNIFFDGQPLPEPPGIRLSRRAIDVRTIPEKYSTYQLRARITPLPNTESVVYVSDYPEVAAVDSNGIVTILKNGKTNITATISGGLVDTCMVTIDVDESAFWIGHAADSFVGGDGTKSHPYQIGTPEQLALMAKNSRLELSGGGLHNEYFELIADIDLAGKEWITIGWATGSESFAFIKGVTRHFNGNGFLIKNMRQGDVFSGLIFAEHGLFNSIWYGEVKDLCLVNANQKNSQYHDWVQGILSYTAFSSTIINCFSTGKTVGSGLIYSIENAVIENCFSTAETQRGFVYECRGSDIRNCYAFGNSYFIYNISMGWTYSDVKSNVINSFLLNNSSHSTYFVVNKSDTDIHKCYSNNYIAPLTDDDPSTTEMISKPTDFFKDIASYTDPTNWEDEYPWDFENVWTINGDDNAGLPYFKFLQRETDEEKVALAKASITWNSIKGDNELPSSVRYDLLLPTSHLYGATVNWTSSDQAVVNNAGVVTRPNHNVGDKNVTLSAIIQSGDVYDALFFHLTVKPLMPTPNLVSSGRYLVATGSIHTLAIKTDGSLWAWGYNAVGELGLGDNGIRLSPSHVMNDVASVVAGFEYTLAIKTDGSLWAWGYNQYGQLGDGSTTNRTTPVKIMDDVENVAVGDYHTLAVKTDGSLWAWGTNYCGQLGDGTIDDSLKPMKIMDDVVNAFAVSNHTFAIKTDGSLWAWGFNYFGQLGDGTTDNRLTPVKIMDNVDDTVNVVTGITHTLLVKTDGSLWGWGSNQMGQLGTSNQGNNVLTPVKIMGDVFSAAAGFLCTLVVKTDGSLWSWGQNSYGVLGDGTSDDRTTPLKIMDDVAIVEVGSNHSLAVKTDGSLWAWGQNWYGQLGDGTTTDSLIPIQIMLPGSILPNNPGVNVSGAIKTYNPKNAATIRLTKGGVIVYETTIEPTDGSGQKEQTFTIEGVLPGTYDLVATKPGHTSLTVKNITVRGENVNLTQNDLEAVRLMTLRCGDINEDGMINDGDLTVLWRAANYDKPVEKAANPLSDLNGDGYINDADLTILWITYNYNRSGIVIES